MGEGLHHVLGEERPLSEHMLSKILERRIPSAVRAAGITWHHWSSAARPPQPRQQGGPAVHPDSEGSGNLLLDAQVSVVVVTSCWKRGVETDSECRLFTNTNVLL